MANTIDWGQGAVNNTNDWGKGKTNATNNWGAIYDSTAAGETNITGSGGVTPFTNTYSMTFDGVDEYFTGAFTFSELDGGTKATFSMWVKPISFSVGRMLFSITKDTTAGNSQVMLYIDTSARLRGFVSTGSRYIYTNPSVLTLNTWHHILFCIDLTQVLVANRGRIFVDGVDQTGSGFSQLAETIFPTSNSELFIGEDKNGFLNPTLGNIDEFAMWVGTDQRANVSDIYNGGVPFDLSTLATAPDHWWRMGDNDTWSGSQWTLTDNIGSYDLTSANMEEADRVTDVPPSVWSNQYSMSFDGVDEYVDIGNPTNLNSITNITISAWFKTTSTVGGLVIVGSDDAVQGRRYILRTISSSGIKLRFISFSSNGSFTDIVGTTIINDGNWHHVMAINDGTNLKLYVDGTLDNSNTNGHSINTTFATPDVNIGRRSYIGNENYFDGQIDEVAIWSNDQSSNVSTIYNGGTPTDLTSLSPLSWWRMGDGDTWGGSSWTLTDNGSGGNDATSVNMEEADRVTDIP